MRSCCKFFFARSLSSFKIKFVDQSKKVIEAPFQVGENILKVAHNHKVNIEGACEGLCACSTCHVILEDKVFQALSPASEEEEDMLDLAVGLTNTSRLGCQVILGSEHDDIVIQLPSVVKNLFTKN